MADALPLLEGQPATLADEEAFISPPRLAELVGSTPEIAQRIINLIDSLEAYDYHDASFHEKLLLPDLGLEDATDKRRSLLETLIQWLKELIKSSVNELTALNEYASWLIHASANLKENSRISSNAFGQRRSFKVTTRVSNLCVRYSPITDAPELLANLTRLQRVVTTFYGYKPLDTVNQVTSQSGRLDLLVKTALQYSPDKLANTGVFFEHPTNHNWHATFPMMDNVRLVIKRRKTDDPHEYVKGLQVRLDPENLTPLPMPSEIEFQSFNLVTSDRILNVIGATAKLLHDQSNISARRQRQNKLDRLTQEIERFKHAGSDVEVSEVLDVLRQYVDWSTNPFTGFYGMVVRTLRASYNVCDYNARR